MVSIGIELGDGNKDDIIKFIDKYGINYIDQLDESIMFHVNKIEQDELIDIIMDRKPDINSLNCMGFLKTLYFFNIRKSMYVMQKMMEYDNDFLLLFVRLDLHFMVRIKLRCGSEYPTILEYLRLLWRVKRGDEFRKHIEKGILLMENHEKKYYKLFDLLKHKIE